MIVGKILYNVNTSGLKKINIGKDINYLKDEYVILKQKQYLCFQKLLNTNKAIKKGSGLKLTIKAIEEISGISKSSYYRIKKEVNIKGSTYWKTLERKSTRPKRFRVSKIPQEYKDIILNIRLKNKTYSEKKIENILYRDYKIKLSHRTIGKILRKFNKAGLIRIKGSKLNKKLKPNEINQTKPRNFNKGYAKRWKFKENSINNKTNKKKKEIDKIGTMIQIDHLKYHNSSTGLKFVEFSAIDPTTRIKKGSIYNSATSKNAKDFLINKLIKEFPFPIKSIQADGGSENKDYVLENLMLALKFDNLCPKFSETKI